MAKTVLPCFYCKRSRFSPCLGTKISLAVPVAETNTNKNTSLIRLGLQKNKDIINKPHLKINALIVSFTMGLE